MAIEFDKSEWGWVDALRGNDQIGTIFIKPYKLWFEPQTNSEEYTIDELEQILSKMKELQGEKA